ncbi:MAG TPA: aminotransferase class III-fold pyridoxal phosphate-dependent enzyme [Aggregatilineales bacterium]|nr:aminotransferase class III-fold pyridoxal phosphate-dependent enzyme [Aggregatilineales bacterium]
MPHLTPADAARLLSEVYNLSASEISALPGEYDLNFRVRTADGQGYVLKVMHPSRALPEIDLQCRALLYAAEHAPGLTLPQPKATAKRDYITPYRLSDDETRLVWMLSWVSGNVMAKVRPHSPELLHSLGAWLGQLTTALAGFTHPAAQRTYKWDIAQAGWIGDYLHHIRDDGRRTLVQGILADFHERLLPALQQTPRSVIHADANDYNVIVDDRGKYPWRVSSVIDFGDLMDTYRVYDVAVACAYAIMDKPDPLATMVQVVAGYHQHCPLTEAEIELIFPLVQMRLAISVTNSAFRQVEVPDDPYVVISERPAWAALEQLAQAHPRLAHYLLRAACGVPAVPHSQRVVEWLSQQTFAPLVGQSLGGDACHVLDLSVSSRMLGANPDNSTCGPMTRLIEEALREAGTHIGIGRYDEARLIYANDLFATGGDPLAERRTIHLGLDVWMPAGTPIYAPLDGVVHCIANNAAPLDYGPLVILRHQTAAGEPFYTLYGHLAEDVLSRRQIGQAVHAGDLLAHMGPPPINGDWPPHVHFQIITDLLERDADFPGVGLASQRPVWLSLSPDPNVVLGIPADRFPTLELPYEETLRQRRSRLGGNLSLTYSHPLKIVRGWRQYLYDDTGRAYLDMYNNVPHVGHTHPRIVKAVQEQVGLLTTNTRYLHDNINRYAERLCAHLPEPLEVCYFVNSASEANELALRLARAYTRQTNLIVMDTAYHGHTTALIDISPYKFNGPGGEGRKAWVHVAPVPDDYRGPYKRSDPERGRKYAAHVAEIIADLQAQGQGLCGFIAESLPSVGGQIIPPPHYLETVYAHVRAAGGVCIADEVQVGFGRLGCCFWGFELQEVVPDIIVLGKPIGNGQPLGAVITTRAIADAFDNGMEFFSTFGGNPVSCAAGLALLDVLEEEQLQANALTIGTFLLDGMTAMMERHPIIGDVRGVGLFLGVELVKDRETLEPAAEQASYLINRLRDHGILAGTDGPYHNVIKLRPSMIFSRADAELFLRTFDSILGEITL